MDPGGLTAPFHPVGDAGGSAHPIHDAPHAPDTALVAPTAHVGPRLDALDRAGRAAGMSSSDRQGYRQAVDQAARSGDLSETTRQLQAFREHVETRALNQRYDAFRQHADGGFDTTRAPQSERSSWDHLVDAVEQARRGGDPDLLDSHLREYTAFVEHHAPSEVLTGRDAPQPYRPDVENIRRQLAVATGADADRLRTELADLRHSADLRDRLDRLNGRPDGPDPRETELRRAVEEADSPDAAAHALAQLHDHRADQDLQQRLDRLNSDGFPDAGAGRDDLRQRLDALRGDAGSHEQELIQQIDHASGPDEAARALDALHDHRDQQDLRDLQQRLDQLHADPVPPPAA
ncbi:hypothetical protein, partial [Streptomyces sp. IBSBF 2435]|uniref:hypothetical protein n=1 Tax=Streptomyces sp. IBSBF 2435 TaxID=2903531 RepID=UPI002FDBFD33